MIVRCEGTDGLAIDPESGALLLETVLGPLVQPVGRCWEVLDDRALKPVEYRYRILDEKCFGFEVPGRDMNLALVLDPEIVWATSPEDPALVWSTYLGSSGGGIGDFATAVDVDAKGDVTVVGECSEPEFPTTPGAYKGFFGDRIAFVTRLRGSDGQLLYSSLIGGDRSRPLGVDVDSAGRATVVGYTFSANFPTTPGAFDMVKNATNDSTFVLRLSPSGSQLEYSTFLEGVQNGSRARGVQVLDSGHAIVGGKANSADFPVTLGALQTSFVADCGFVTRFDSAGSTLEWSTFLGESSRAEVLDLAVDSQGNVTATGLAGAGFPTTPGAFQSSVAFDAHVFVTRLESTGRSQAWGTYVGGNGRDEGNTLALSRTGDVVVGGVTRSTDFPVTPGAVQGTFQGGFWDGFVLRLDSTGSELKFSTYLGGGSTDFVTGVAVGPSGVVTATGSSVSTFPTTPGAYRTINELFGYEMFVSRFRPGGTQLYYSSLLGGSFDDTGGFLGVSSPFRVALAGESWAPGTYPTTPGAPQPNYVGGQRDAVATTMDLLLDGVKPRGNSKPSCLGPIALNVTEMPLGGASSFGLYVEGAPPSADGWLRVSLPRGASWVTDVGLGKVTEPPSWVVPIRSDAEGFVEIPMSLAPGSEGARFRCRTFFVNTPLCPGTGSLCWSQALEVVVQ